MSVMMSVPPPLMFVLVGGMFVCCKDGGHCSNISSSEAGETPPTSLKLPPWHGESFVPARILQPQHHGWWVGVVCWCGGVGVVVLVWWCGVVGWCGAHHKEKKLTGVYAPVVGKVCLTSPQTCLTVGDSSLRLGSFGTLVKSQAN